MCLRQIVALLHFPKCDQVYASILIALSFVLFHWLSISRTCLKWNVSLESYLHRLRKKLATCLFRGIKLTPYETSAVNFGSLIQGANCSYCVSRRSPKTLTHFKHLLMNPRWFSKFNKSLQDNKSNSNEAERQQVKVICLCSEAVASCAASHTWVVTTD